MYMILWKKYIKLDYVDIDSESFNKLLLFNFVEIQFRALLFYFCFLSSRIRDAENVHLNKWLFSDCLLTYAILREHALENLMTFGYW